MKKKKLEDTYFDTQFSIIEEESDIDGIEKIQKELKLSRRKQVLHFSILIGAVLLLLLLLFIFRPRIILNGTKDMKVLYQGEYKEQGAYASIFGVKDKDVHKSGEVDTTKLGTYPITYTYQKGILKLKNVRNVKVVDEEKPIITLTGGDEVLICPNHEFVEIGYQVTDNYDQDLTSKVKTKIDKKNNIVHYEVEDSSKNKQVTTRKLIRKDEQVPVITLNGISEEVMYVGQTYIEDGYQAVDNCDGDLTSKVIVEGTVDTSKVGENILTYKVVDSASNETVVQRKVKVVNRPNNSSSGNGDGIIYLTFDDGPSATITPTLLDILKEENVKATFFVINHSSNLDYLIKRAHDEGHTVALHSYSHNYSSIYSSSTAYFNDLQAISNKVKNITGVESMIIRFPGGSSNTVSRFNPGIMTRLTSEVLNRGYHYFDWNVGSGDAGEAKTAAQVYNNVVGGLSHSKTNIVLLHDFENNYKTLNAIRDIIHFGKNNGYQFSSINMSTSMVRHRVAN